MNERAHHALVVLLMFLCLIGGIGQYFWQQDIRRNESAMLFDTLSEAMAMADTGYWRLDIETGETVWSEKLREVYGIPGSPNSNYENWLSVVHPEDRERADEICSRALHDLQPYVMDYRVIDALGGVRQIREYAAVTADGKKMVGFCKRIDTPPEEFIIMSKKKGLWALEREQVLNRLGMSPHIYHTNLTIGVQNE